MRILLTLAYDGTGYCGWQRQANGLTVQEVLESALCKALNMASVTTIASSRTDAGVHALCQKAAFTVEGLLIPLDKLPNVINSRLPGNVVVKKAEAVPDDFNPRYMARRKTYEYRFYHGEYMNPLLKDCFFIPRYDGCVLDIGAMNKAAGYFVGTHDFTAFCATGGSAKTSTRTVYDCSVSQTDNREGILITVSITGNGFLYNMVRIIAGTLLYVGKEKLCAQDIPGILLSKNRARAGQTLPPHGLTLISVCF